MRAARVLPFCMIEFTVTRKHSVFWHNMLLWEPRNFTISEQEWPPWGVQKTWEFEKGSLASLPKAPFYSQSIQDVHILFAYLWEMGVTVIKLTGIEFCRVWIMKSYKMWKSKDIFLKICLSTLWQSQWSLTSAWWWTHAFGYLCQKMAWWLPWLLQDVKKIHDIC